MGIGFSKERCTPDEDKNTFGPKSYAWDEDEDED